MQSRLYIESFDCVTSTAKNPQDFWNALLFQQTGIEQSDISTWPAHFKAFWKDQPNTPISCKIQNSQNSYLETLATTLSELGSRCLTNKSSSKMGIILATTKGATEDYIWDKTLKMDIDPLYLVLEKTIGKLPKTNWLLTQVVSNSCASSHAAIALAKKWLDAGACDKVLVLAGDLIGPFIHTGFQSLKALSHSSGKPFQAERDGLVLGEAMTSLLISKTPSEIELVDVQISNEAHTVTGPSSEGRGLKACVDKLAAHKLAPDFAIAHGTATQLNDITEDFVLCETQKLFDRAFPITGTKWSIGHTLGASGSIDTIAAIMCLKKEALFPLPGVGKSQELKAENFLFNEVKKGSFETALVTSLGFGGTNGALLLRRNP